MLCYSCKHFVPSERKYKKDFIHEGYGRCKIDGAVVYIKVAKCPYYTPKR